MVLLLWPKYNSGNTIKRNSDGRRLTTKPLLSLLLPFGRGFPWKCDVSCCHPPSLSCSNQLTVLFMRNTRRLIEIPQSFWNTNQDRVLAGCWIVTATWIMRTEGRGSSLEFTVLQSQLKDWRASRRSQKKYFCFFIYIHWFRIRTGKSSSWFCTVTYEPLVVLRGISLQVDTTKRH